MTPTKAPRYFDFDQIARLDQMTMDAIEHACRPFNARLGTLGDAVCFGKILAHIKQSGRHHRERSMGLYDWVRSLCPEGLQFSDTHIDRFIAIARLDPAEVMGYSMSLVALGKVADGPLDQDGPAAAVRRLLLSLGERATTTEQVARLARAAGVAVALLALGTPLDEVLKRCEGIALGQVKLPGMSPRGRPKATKAQAALKTVRSLRSQLMKITDNSELALEILNETLEAYQLARYRAGLDLDLPEDTPPPARVAPSPPAPPAASAPGGTVRTAGTDSRRYPRTPEEPSEAGPLAGGFDINVNDNNDLEGSHGINSAAAEQDDEDEVPDDYYLPMVHAVMAALDPVAQAELGEVMAHVVAGQEVEEFEWTVNNLWEHCRLEAAGVDKEDFDFFMGHLCGPDRVLGGRHALAFLSAAQPPDWGMHLRGLLTIELPAELKAEVAALCQRVPPVEVEVPGEGEEEEETAAAAQEREVKIADGMAERIMAQLSDASPHEQRDLLMEGYQLWRRLRGQGFLGTNPEPMPAKTMSFGSLIWKV